MNPEQLENQRMLRRRSKVFLLLLSVLVLVFCLGVYFGFFAGHILGVGA